MAKKKKSRPVDPDAAPAAVLPPLPKVEIDAKWKWPPFPTPPEGVTIVSFDQFEAKGVVISFGETDDVELDGEGVPTVAMQVKHTIGGDKRRKGKKKKGPLAELSEEELRKMTWEKRWELGEPYRSAPDALDHRERLEDRFIESTRMFQQGRQWNAVLQGNWDQFRIYAGILSNLQAPGSRRGLPLHDEDDDRPGAEQPDEVGEALVSDDEDEEHVPLSGDVAGEDAVDTKAEASKAEADAHAAKEKREERDYETYRRLLEAKAERTSFFVENLELATKVFFSSFFRDRGLLWSPVTTRDLPFLLQFYFKFVIRNKMFPEKDFNRSLHKALDVVERAIAELPYTFTMSRSLPDKWGIACTALWGTQEGTDIFFEPTISAPAPEEPDAEEVEAEIELVEAVFHGNGQHIRESADLLTESNHEPEPEPEGAVIEEVIEEGDEAPKPDAENESHGWGGEAVQPKLEESGWERTTETAWDKEAPLDPKDPWSLSNQEPDWGDERPKISTFFPEDEGLLTNVIPIDAEASPRIIADILHPDPSSANPLVKKLARLVMKPWKDPVDDEDSSVHPPVMISIGAGNKTVAISRKRASRHDPTKDDIHIFIDPGVVENIKIGMGLRGIWIRVGEKFEEEEEVATTGEPPKRKKKPAKGSEKDWWYMERVALSIPSFWTEQAKERDMTRLENHPEYAFDR